jgi:hypothetical protein
LAKELSVADLDPVGQVRPQAGAHHEIAGAVDLAVAGAHLEVRVAAAHGHHFLAVGHLVVDLRGGPLEVVVELDPQREQVLVVDEIDQAAPAVQVGQETEPAGRISHRDQIFEEGHLHRRVLEQHAAMPAEPGLALQEMRGHRLGGGGVVLGHGDRQREVGGPETHPDQVELRRY